MYNSRASKQSLTFGCGVSLALLVLVLFSAEVLSWNLRTILCHTTSASLAHESQSRKLDLVEDLALGVLNLLDYFLHLRVRA
jgi:hypothetical protein